jgi:hypothetical protein
MKKDDILSTFSSSTMREGATQASIDRLELWVGKPLPDAYVRLVSRSNGVEGFLADGNYLVLWPVEQLPELNQAYSVAEFAPGLLLVGSDGAEMGYAIDTRQQPMSVKEVPFVGMSNQAAREVASSFEGFLEYLKHR